MANKQTKIYLGYEDEIITDKNLTQVDYRVNKIGGFPNWPPLENLQFSSKCPLCSLHRLLITQCYATFENSVYHRILYVFACINPNCWIQSESWTCVRIQVKDTGNTVDIPNEGSQMSWCNSADDWDENDNGDSANGNLVNVDNMPSPNNSIQRNSDEDEESNSFELETVEQALGNMQVYDAHIANANLSPTQGAVGAIGVPAAAAELEGGDEPGLVSVDTPTVPTSDIPSLLNKPAELPADIRSRLMCAPLQFTPKYIYVDEEWIKHANDDERAIELLNRYKRDNAIEAACAGDDDAQYEEPAPLHGDRLLHAFQVRLRMCPGQILRYSRDAPPLLGAPLPSAANSPVSSPAMICNRCGSRLTCELQLVPEFAYSLQLHPTNGSLSHLKFLSVLVFTCSQSCWQDSDTLVKETVVFQPEA